MQPALEFRHALLSAPNLSVPIAFSDHVRVKEPVASGQRSLLEHDLRAAVSDIIGGLRSVSHEGLEAGARLQLERVRATGEQLSRLMDEALSMMLGDHDFVVAQSDDIQLPGLISDLQAQWRGRAHEKGLTFTATLAENAPQALALNRIALDRILSNVISNAIKYSDGGNVALHVDLSPTDQLRMVVTDDGPGFSAEALSRLFDFGGRPHDTAEPGHGLGLHIVRDMAGRLGGAITVENRLAGGTGITLELPPTSWAKAAIATPHPELPDLSRFKVLVADDSPTNQLIISQMLARMGAEFAIAPDGVAALHRLKTETFDLALVDIEMPHLSGLDVIRRVRASEGRLKTVPVIAITAHVLRSDCDAILAAGADEILTKPLAGIEAFGATIEKLLHRVEASAEGAAPAATPAPEQIVTRLEQLVDLAGPDSGHELLSRLCTDLRNAQEGMLRGYAEGAVDRVRSCTHTLIAIAGAAGAEELLALACALNNAAQASDIADQGAALRQALVLLEQLIMQAETLRLRRGEV